MAVLIAVVVILIALVALSGGIRIRAPLDEYEAVVHRLDETSPEMRLTDLQAQGQHLYFLQCGEWAVHATFAFDETVIDECEYMQAGLTRAVGPATEREPSPNSSSTCAFRATLTELSASAWVGVSEDGSGWIGVGSDQTADDR